MERPDGISPDVWEKACECVPYYVATAIKEKIALAIQSAVEAERSRCMGIALSFIQYGGDTHHGITENPMADVRDVAAAIRKGA